ncbi:substrate carrier family protein N [Seminavis robusta]|uniref:Substrate carrier family protein N n=1 Tax=Seminavis robusta TaxID=568900 RepID=A0A9N8HUJ1_9STRA|nr:substrate carrier family protein N [Seminavis robusta]|eukprot:Sro1390_g268630.1 substrate carrier family protein N (900) ;mRNA; r:8958-11748
MNLSFSSILLIIGCWGHVASFQALPNSIWTKKLGVSQSLSPPSGRKWAISGVLSNSKGINSLSGLQATKSSSQSDDSQEEETNSSYGLDRTTRVGTLQPMNRRVFMAAAAAAIVTNSVLLEKATAADNSKSASTPPLPWETNPVNKRSGVTVTDVETVGYNVAFVTYLSRFLLNFDQNCQRYWFTGVSIPQTATSAEVERIRLDQFAAFSASVELGLRQYNQGSDGPKQLLQDLVQKYGTIPDKNIDDSKASERRVARAARRQIALLFGLMEVNQPTKEITKLLAAVDNGRVSSVQLNKDALQMQGFELGREPIVTFNPPQAGDSFQVAEGRVVLKPTGNLLRLDIVNGGSGYSSPAIVTVSPPPTEGGITAKVQAKIVKGQVESLRIIDTGSGYTDKDPIEIVVVPTDGEPAVVAPVLNMAISRIDVTREGSGYAVEKPTKVYLTPFPENISKNKGSSAEPVLIGLTYPVAEKSSFTSFRKDDDTKELRDQESNFEKRYNLQQGSGAVSGIDSGAAAPRLPFWTGRASSSAELLRMLPAGVGLEYDSSAKRYALAMDTEYMKKYPAFLQQGSSRIIGTEFGPRGRAPIERDRELDLSAYLRFSLSGATCASAVHLALTPLDVAKTRLQTAPDKNPNIATAFQNIAQEDGLSTFFTGWIPTILGNFLSGGVLYVTTEFIRRYLTEAAGVEALNLEVPIILAAAAVASALGAVLSCPFEAVRIRTVAQPDFAPNSIEVFTKMLQEEGIGSLTDAIPVFLVRNIPYAMTKFTIFDISTERLYEAFPAAQEDIKLSLLVSLVGGILGGSAAACVSNPADAVISELKKSSTELTPQQAVANMLERNGVATFFVGLPLRIVFYSLIASMTFVVYDFVRILLRIGPDDLRLYLDVLNGSLGNSPS